MTYASEIVARAQRELDALISDRNKLRADLAENLELLIADAASVGNLNFSGEDASDIADIVACWMIPEDLRFM